MKKTNGFFEDWQNLIDDFEKFTKSENNPFFKSKYVPLKEILPVVKSNCHKHNFVFMQLPTVLEGKNYLKTLIKHIDGDQIEGLIELVSKDPNDPQKLGGAITYMRRYSLTCMFGLEEDDDDGNNASNKKTDKKTQATTKAICSLCGSQGILKEYNGRSFVTCPNYWKHKEEKQTFKMIDPPIQYTNKEKAFVESLNVDN